MNRRITATVATATLMLSGCMVGPKYVKPAAPLAPDFKEDKAWQRAQPADTKLRGTWWTMFSDSQLNELEPQIATENQTAKQAEARFREARALIQFNRASLAPTIGTSPSYAGLRESSNRPYFSSINANSNGIGGGDLQLPLSISYEVDLWGRIRRSVSAAREEATASAGDYQSALLSLQSELAVDYFEARAADAEEKLLNDTVKTYDEAYRITSNRFEGGVSPKSDVDQAKTQLEAARVQASDVAVIRAQYEHAIAVLIGKPPASFTLAASPLATQPPSIPVALPSELLERRPDISAAERRMAEQNDRVGIATAAYYPTVSFSAAAGLEATTITNLAKTSSILWSAGPTVSETLFDYGRRRSVVVQAKATYDETVANYRQTTLTAFQQVEDNLAVLRVLQNEAEQQHRATEAAESAVQIFNNRYVGGLDTYLQVVTAQTTALVNERNDIDIERRQMDASVLLIKALGGGWDTSQLPKL
ncbi:efflux transporter outer membrane subunit [Granulicella arctica]|uniref:efflux transporter outer membrane subunit n=1 Tax=Granulicella arctica TaxID=940613 RepID=UPI0021E07F8E|nr:efflux transporter outer membrane subunit [Granulicella arctica]